MAAFSISKLWKSCMPLHVIQPTTYNLPHRVNCCAVSQQTTNETTRSQQEQKFPFSFQPEPASIFRFSLTTYTPHSTGSESGSPRITIVENWFFFHPAQPSHPPPTMVTTFLLRIETQELFASEIRKPVLHTHARTHNSALSELEDRLLQ